MKNYVLWLLENDFCFLVELQLQDENAETKKHFLDLMSQLTH